MTIEIQSHSLGQPIVKAVICDLDGTLIDYEGASHEALRVVEKYTEKAFTWDLHGEIVGRRPHGPDGWASGILCSLEIPEHVLSEERYIEEVHEEVELHFGKITLMEGAIELLERFAAKKVPVAIATSSVRSSFDKKMAYHKRIVEIANVIVCGDDPELDRGKPHPDIFLLAAKRLGVPEIDKCIVFEDSPAGIQGAKSAGMLAVGIPDARFKQKKYIDKFAMADWVTTSLIHFDEENHIVLET